MPIAIVVILIAVIVPLPTIILDVLISANIALAVVILLSSVYVLSPDPVFSFPSILLLSTLFRLSLNIASTRLILLNGSRDLRPPETSSRLLVSSWWAATLPSAS